MKSKGKRVLIKPDEREEQTESGIILPKKRENQWTGEVLSVGENVQEVKEGMRVMYNQWKQDKVDDLISVFEKDVVAIL